MLHLISSYISIMIFLRLPLTTIAVLDHYYLPIVAYTSFGSDITKPGCPNKCGDIQLPYPFGINSSCSLNPVFTVRCDESFNPPKTFIGDDNIEILAISENVILARNRVAWSCYQKIRDEPTSNRFFSMNLSTTPLTFSTDNKLTLVGCDDVALLSGTGEEDDYISSCVGICSKPQDLSPGLCTGIGCSQASIPSGLDLIFMTMATLMYHKQVINFTTCGYAFLAQENSYVFNVSDVSDSSFVTRIVERVPIVLDWYIGNQSCDQTICKGYSWCAELTSVEGYRCACLPGFQGNPYLSPGCQDINECESDPCHETAICTNLQGSFNCSCPLDYQGDSQKNGAGCIFVTSPKQIALFAGLPIGLGSFVLVAVTFWLYKMLKKRRVRQIKQMFFKRNGGLLLKQQMSAHDSFFEKMKIFTSKELERATDRFNESRILGHGGQGTVYKGMLSDGRIVAVKKSMQVNEDQREEFINEVVILSLINHRNVVKLLGCCLETEVPLLVYEFVPNGTLYHLILDQDTGFPFSWELRLRVAAEIANALAYLHYATSFPIYHRDMKSSNILLDEKYRAKLSDFGISRSVAIDQTHLTTKVKGTFGYLDPEYFQTGKFTEKSDVYSFGVVLVELLTGQKPIGTKEEDRSLVTQFLLAMEDKSLKAILDYRIIEQGVKDEHLAVCDLAKRCLNLNGKKRPTIREVAMELERINKCDNPSSFESNVQELSLDIESFLGLDVCSSTLSWSDD